MKTVKISGSIGYDVTPDSVRDQLVAANGEDVRIEISSPGGYVFDGIEIFNLIRNYSGNTEIHLMGLAASMASYIAMAGKKIVAEDNAVFMIHNVSAGSMGDHRDMRKVADVIESLSNMLSQKYVEKTGKSIDEIRKMMDDETYLFGNEIKESGFADEMVEAKEKTEKEEAVKTARAVVSLCVGKMKSDEKASSSLMKAAAMVAPKNNQPPKEKTNDQGVNMNELENFLNANSSAKAQLDAMIQAKVADAVKASGESFIAKSKRIAAFVGGDSTYPKSVKNLAVKALLGEVEMAALDGAVTVIDAQAEEAKAAAAKKETGKQPATPPASETVTPENGVANTEEELQAIIAAKKAEKKGKE